MKKAIITGKIKTPIGTITPLKTIAAGAGVGALALGAAAPAVAGRVLLGGAKAVIPKTLGGKITAVTIGAAATTSPTLRNILKKKANPVSAGRTLGTFIETDVVPKVKGKSDKPITDVIKKGAAAAGIAGAAAAAAGGVIKAIESKKEKPKVMTNAAKQIPATAPETSTPLSAVQKATTAPAMPAAFPTIKVLNKPSINIKINNTGINRRFINQQNLIRR